MTNVLQFVNSRVRGGLEEQVLILLREFDRSRFRFFFVRPPELAARVREDVPVDVEIIELALDWPTQLGAILRFARILRSRRIDILHSHGFVSSMVASPTGWLCRIPLIIESAHGREAWRKGWKAKCYVDRIVGYFVDHYTAVSAANARYLIDTKRYPAQKISIIHPGSDLTKFAVAHRPPPQLKQQYGFGPGDPVVVVVGRLEPQKGHRVLLDAIAIVQHRIPHVRLVCVGEGSIRNELQAHARALGIEPAVRFVGYWPDTRDWLAVADVSVLPSFHEGLPVTPVESLAAGCPVVATAVDGTVEVVLDGQTGLTVPVGDSRALANAICTVLDSSELRQQLASAGRDWVFDHFSSHRMVERVQRLYTQMAPAL